MRYYYLHFIEEKIGDLKGKTIAQGCTARLVV